jgi:hypothetical protein
MLSILRHTRALPSFFFLVSARHNDGGASFSLARYSPSSALPSGKRAFLPAARLLLFSGKRAFLPAARFLLFSGKRLSPFAGRALLFPHSRLPHEGGLFFSFFYIHNPNFWSFS